MKSKFKIIVIVNGDERNNKSFTLESRAWGSVVLKAHDMIQERMRREDFKMQYKLKAIIKVN